MNSSLHGRGLGLVHLHQMNSSAPVTCAALPKIGCKVMIITMRDRSKNRKQLQKGRNLSIEAIQTVQILKRASVNSLSEESLEQVLDRKFRRLLKFDMIAVLRELLRQNQCQLALKVFEEVKKEDWYKPQLLLYADMVTVLGRNGLLEEVELIIRELNSESKLLTPDREGFNALLESLMSLNLTGLAMECFSLMKSISCEPDRSSYEILINGIRSHEGESHLLSATIQEAQKYYGSSIGFIEKEEIEANL